MQIPSPQQQHPQQHSPWNASISDLSSSTIGKYSSPSSPLNHNYINKRFNTNNNSRLSPSPEKPVRGGGIKLTSDEADTQKHYDAIDPLLRANEVHSSP